MRLYHLVCFKNGSGRKVYMTGYPMTHKECITMRSKFSRPNDLQLEEVTSMSEITIHDPKRYARLSMAGAAYRIACEHRRQEERDAAGLTDEHIDTFDTELDDRAKTTPKGG